LIRQWEREIRTKIANSHRQSTFIYHSGKKTSWDNLRTYDVVLTTYGTIGAEFKRRIIWQKKVDENPDMDRSDEKKLFPFLGEASKWYRIILDEAQCIKNKNTKAAQATYGLKALTRFCLTGTPMMNGVHELASLIHFLRIRPYNSFTRFNQVSEETFPFKPPLNI
jgi:SNF2 family DNA or RNA helicase